MKELLQKAEVLDSCAHQQGLPLRDKNQGRELPPAVDKDWIRDYLRKIHAFKSTWLTICMDTKRSDPCCYHLWKVMDTREFSVTEERQTHCLTSKGPKQWFRELQADQPHVGSQETGTKNYGACPLGRHFWAHKQEVTGSSHNWPTKLPTMTKSWSLWSSECHSHQIWQRF